MKYSITLTSENLAFIDSLPKESAFSLLLALKDKMDGKDVVIDQSIEKEFVNLCSFMQPIKKQSLGTAQICTVCADRLNSLLGTRYKPNSQSMKTHVSARIREGYGEADFIAVIDKKVAEWIGTEQEKYLRPETLFGTKFEGYLNQSSSVTATPSTGQIRSNNYSEDLP